jgi:hypothetical protein
MRTLAFLLILGALSGLQGCASVPPPKPLSAAEIVGMVREGKGAQEIIAELQRTGTVLPLRASDIVALHDAGVPTEVLNYLQIAQIEDIRWRERSLYWYGPSYAPRFGPYYGWGPCPWRRSSYGC